MPKANSCSTRNETHNVGNVSERHMRALRRSKQIANNKNIDETSTSTSSVGHSSSKGSTKSISQKLDETLLEMDQIKKKFAKSLTEVKQCQDELEKRMRQLNSDANEKVHNLLVEFNERCGEIQEELIVDLEAQAIKLICKDNEHNKAFIVMLKENVSTAILKN